MAKAAPGFFRRLFTSQSRTNVAALSDQVLHLEGKLRRAEESLGFYGLPFIGTPVGGSSSLYGFGYGQALDDNGLPAVPWVTGTPSDRQWGKLAPIFWTEQQLAWFRMAARWVADTNPFGVGFMDLLPAVHIQKGCGWRVRLKGQAPGEYAGGTNVTAAGGTVDERVEAAQRILDEWRAASRWVWRSREGFRRWRRDGDVFFRFFPNMLGRLPDVRFVEPEQISNPDGSASSNRSFGIECDPRDREHVLWYYIRYARDDQQWVWEKAAAGDVVHLKANVDASIKRGLPDFFPVGADLDRIRRLLTNMGETAVGQSAIAWREGFAMATGPQVSNIIQQGQDYSTGKITPNGMNTQSVSQFTPGTIYRTEGSRTINEAPAANSEAYISVEQALLRGCGVRWNFPEYFSGDASNQNLASIRESGSPFVLVSQGRQQDWCEGVERPVSLRVLQEAERSGLVPPGTCAAVDVDVEPPAVALSDKSQDEDIREVRFRNGVLSRRTWQIQAGLDPTVEDANGAAVQKPEVPQAFQKPGEPPPPEKKEAPPNAAL